jgi:hypothetical protein
LAKQATTGNDVLEGFTYNTSAKGCFMDCSLRVEMTQPDSMNDIDIETFWVIGKPMEI